MDWQCINIDCVRDSQVCNLAICERDPNFVGGPRLDTEYFAFLAGHRCLLLFDPIKQKVVAKRTLKNIRPDREVCSAYNGRFVISNQQKLEFYECDRSGVLKNTESILAHSRTVNDVDINSMDPNVLASASADGDVHLWDIRTLKRPVSSLPMTGYVTQCKWSKMYDKILACASETGGSCIWDLRQMSSKYQFECYGGRINAISWFPQRNFCLLASNNKSMQLLRSKEASPEDVYRSKFPVKTMAISACGHVLGAVLHDPSQRQAVRGEELIIADTDAILNRKAMWPRALVAPGFENPSAFAWFGPYGNSQLLCVYKDFKVGLWQREGSEMYPGDMSGGMERQGNSFGMEGSSSVAMNAQSVDRNSMDSFSEDNPTVVSSSMIGSYIPTSPLQGSMSFLPAYQDTKIPFPRSCGAAFNGVGKLVIFTFGKVTGQRLQVSLLPSGVTPRSMASLKPYSDSYLMHGSGVMHSGAMSRRKGRYHHHHHHKQGSSSSGSSSTPKKTPAQYLATDLAQVVIFDASCLHPYVKPPEALSLCREQPLKTLVGQFRGLAEKWDREDGCREDGYRIWGLIVSMLDLACRLDQIPDKRVWESHPFAQPLLLHLIDHFGLSGDVQSLAYMYACLQACVHVWDMADARSGESLTPRVSTHSAESAKSSISPYNTIHADHGLNKEGLKSLMATFVERKRTRSNSCDVDAVLADNRGDFCTLGSLIPTHVEQKLWKSVQIYADVLYMWGFFNQRAKLLKLADVVSVMRRPPEKENQNWRERLLSCSVCQCKVKGLAIICPRCHHGGHKNHILEYFSQNAGCIYPGCNCKMCPQFH